MNRKSASWAKSIKQIFSPVRKKRTSARLNLESLDARIVPAVFPATDLGSLRAAITGANKDDGTGIGGATQLITIDATGTYTFTSKAVDGFGDNDNIVGDFDIYNNNSKVAVKTYILQGINGTPTIDAASVDRIFQILTPAGTQPSIVKFQNLKLINGQAVDDGNGLLGEVDAKGGGILNSGGGDVFLTSVSMTSNSAASTAATSALRGTDGVAGTILNPNGTPGKDAKSAYGGAIYSSGGKITITGTGTQFKYNYAIAGSGGDGGAGYSPAVKGNGGNGADGGRGGDGFGGAIYIEAGSLSLSADAQVLSNSATGGSGGSGGTGGAGSVTGNGGNAGNGGRGGDAGGGGIFVLNGDLTLNGNLIQKNQANAGDGSNPEAGGDAAGPGRQGGIGGRGGDGGDAYGGGVAVMTGNVTLNGGVQFLTNSATGGDGYDGYTGGAGGKSGGKGGRGGDGGDGGDALGGGLYAGNGTVTVAGGVFQKNTATGGDGSYGYSGGTGNIGGDGGNGGDGGKGAGGAIYVEAGKLTLTGVAIQTNSAIGGSGSEGYSGGDAVAKGGRGGDGGVGGDALGGGVYVGTASLTVAGGNALKNVADAGTGGEGYIGGSATAAAGVGGDSGNGGNGGNALGGAFYVANGAATFNGGAVVKSNAALGGNGYSGYSGGDGGTQGTGGRGGDGGDGGKAGGGGIYAEAGSVTLDGGVQVFLNRAIGGNGESGYSGGDAKFGGNGGNGGAGGAAVGGGIGVASGDVTIQGGSIIGSVNTSGGSPISGNFIRGGRGSTGGNAGTPSNSGVGGVGGRGGDGGAAHGGGVWAGNGTVTISGAVVSNNGAQAGGGGDGNKGQGSAAAKGGAGGNGGDAGESAGGGVYVGAGTVTINGFSQIQNNLASGAINLDGTVTVAAASTAVTGTGTFFTKELQEGDFLFINGVNLGRIATITDDTNLVLSTAATAAYTTSGFGANFALGGNGSSRGAGLGNAANGNGGKGGSALGGGIYIGSAALTLSEHSIVKSNSALGYTGGNAAKTGVAGGPRGTGGAGGDGIGGGIYGDSGSITVNSSLVVGNYASGADGGKGGTGANGTGPGKGGDGGLSAGGGIAINTGSVVLNGAALGQVTKTNGVSTGVSGTGNYAGYAGDGGKGKQTGGNGGSSLGGGLYAPATATSVVVLNSSFFLNSAYYAGNGGSGSVSDGKGGDTLGGGIYAAAASVKIVNSTIAQNEAYDTAAYGAGSPNGVSEGGGVYINSKAGEINNSTVVYNFAYDDSGNPVGLGGGIRNKGTLSLVSTIVGRNNNADGWSYQGTNAANNSLGGDVSNGGTITGTNDLVENGLGVGIASGTNGNLIGKSFLNPTFNQVDGGSQNTVFVDAPSIGAPQTASNGTQYYRLATSAEFNASSSGNPLGKLPANPVTAIDVGLNTTNPIDGKPLATDQIGNARQQGAQVDIGSIEGNGQVSVTSGARVLSAVFSGTQPNTFDKVVVTFSEAMQANTFGPGDVTLLDPNGKAVTILAVTPEAGSNTVFDVTFAPQGVAGVYSYTEGVDILNVVGGFQMNQNQNSVNGETPPTSPDDLFRTTATLVVPPGQAGILAVGNVGGTVRILQANDGTQIANVKPLGANYTGGVSVALADFNGDNVADLAVSAVDPVGTNGLTSDKAGKIFIYDGVDLAKGTLTLTNTLTPFATSTSGGAYTNGLNVAAGDINGDGAIDIVAGSRGQIGSANGPIGKVEQGRLAVVNVADGALIGSIITPFGAGYQKGVVVAAGDLDGVVNGSGHIQDEIGVTRGGPVAKSLPADIQTIKLKAFKFAGSGLVELDLAGNGGASAFAPFAPLPISRDARVAFVDTDGDGKSQLVFSALDPSKPTTANVQVRIAAFDVNTTSGLATPKSNGTGPSNSYVVGNNIIDHSIAAVAPNGGNLQNLVLVTQSNTSQVQYLDPLTGATATTGFAIALVNGGVNVDGF